MAETCQKLFFGGAGTTWERRAPARHAFASPVNQFHRRSTSRIPGASYRQDLIAKFEQTVTDIPSPVQADRFRVTLRQSKRPFILSHPGRGSGDHLEDMKFRRAELAFDPFQLAPDLGIDLRDRVEQRAADERRAEDRLAVSVIRIAAGLAHDAAGRRAAAGPLRVAAAADLEDAARPEEGVQPFDQFAPRNACGRLRLKRFSLRARAVDAEDKFAIDAGSILEGECEVTTGSRRAAILAAEAWFDLDESFIHVGT